MQAWEVVRPVGSQLPTSSPRNAKGPRGWDCDGWAARMLANISMHFTQRMAGKGLPSAWLRRMSK